MKVKEIIEKICMRHLKELDGFELLFLHGVANDFINRDYEPLGSVMEEFEKWLKKNES